VRAILEALRYAPHLRLLHFSACLMMQDEAVVGRLAELSRQARLPVSGYATSVDLAASAIIEVAYLELVLCRGLSAAAAAEQVRMLLPFAGDQEMPGAVFRPAGLRLVTPAGLR